MTSGLCTTSLRFCPRPIPFTRFVITPRGYPLLKVGGLNLSKVTSRSGTAATAVPTVALGCFSGSQRCFFHKQCGSSHRFDSMNAQEIIAWTEAAAKSGEINRALWTAAAQRLSNVLESSGAPATCVIRCLRAFRSAGFVDLPLLKSAVNPCLRGLHRMKPTDLTQLLQIYDEAQYRPERLVTQILGALQTSTDVMFPEEISDVLSALAALHLANPSLLASLARAIATQLTRFTYLQLTALTGALRQLNVQSDVLFGLIEDRLNLEVQLMTIQEVLHTHQVSEKACVVHMLLLRNSQTRFLHGNHFSAAALLLYLQNIKTLNLSWKPYEDCVEAELRKVCKLILCVSLFQTGHLVSSDKRVFQRLGALQGNRDIEQFADPMAAFAWVEQQKLASPQYLKALAGWCAHECGKAEPRLDATDLLRVYNALRYVHYSLLTSRSLCT